MKTLKTSAIAILSLLIFSCSNDATIENNNEQAQTSADFSLNKIEENDSFKKDVALLNYRIRSLDEYTYVKELVFHNFSRETQMGATVTHNRTSFFDDGSYNDEVAGDGIYTSAARYEHNEIVPFFEEHQLISVMDGIAVDRQFAHAEALSRLEAAQNLPLFLNNTDGNVSLQQVGGGIELDCDVEFGTCGCYADEWGWCDCCCVTVSNCHVTVSLSF
ncbi:hypothetical protein GCM10011344_40210 [Dokdonia pacifica]|uniref:Lipoprotein n=1 Tax=Dokdonia pacifica TaxID=1627892 RepID=A0A239A839_9FLAO|nr:choice-of-anchor X domain-containing protein [Dokdonia pacifica]GGG35322.1 hypothetical protein GCM10011344_40210 [Dokdonia pacifica]SNR91481.1 hypothetical protein SAMN06265376_104203 [Dokdonia pacifica]